MHVCFQLSWVELLGHVVILCFTFCGTVHLFYSSGAVSFPSAGSEGSNVSTPSPNTCYYRFGSGRPSGCEVASYCDLGWHHSNDECCWASALLLGPLYTFFEEMSVRIFGPCKKWSDLSFRWCHWIIERIKRDNVEISIHSQHPLNPGCSFFFFFGG